MSPPEASTSPLCRSHRWPAIVVEPTSIARPKARSTKPGQMPIRRSPASIATVTFQSPARSAGCRPCSTARSQASAPICHCAAQRLLQALEVAALGVHVGLGDLDIVQAHDRIERDRAHLGALAHDLPVHLALGRNVDHDVAQERAWQLSRCSPAMPLRAR